MLESNKKPKKFLLKFLIIYTILAILVTFGLLYFHQKTGQTFIDYLLSYIKNTNNNNIEENISKQEDSQKEDFSKFDEIKRTSFLDKYYNNNIQAEVKTITMGNIIDYDYQNNPIYKLTATYPEIKGLKNKEVQNKINEKIKETAKSFIEDDKIYNPDTYKIVVDLYITGNFSDLLSLQVYRNTMYNDNIPYPESYDIKYDTLNFRLDNGQEIKFKDLFTKDASPKNILAQSIYDNLALEYGISNDDGSSDLASIDYGKIENDVFENVYSFINQDEENQNFFFNETDIYVFVDNDNMITIDLKKYSDYINIYNILSPSESLYESGNREKVNYAFGINYFYNFEYYNFVDDNKFLSIYNMYKPDSGNVYMENSENIETFSKVFSDYKNKIIDAVKKDIKNASSKRGYLYNISFFNLPDTENGFPSFSGQRLEIDLTNFEEKQEEIYALGARQNGSGEFIYNLPYFPEEELKDYDIISYIPIEIKSKDSNGEFEVFLDEDFNNTDIELNY